MNICSICRLRPPSGLASAYYRWQAPGQEWVGYRMLLCKSDFVQALDKFLQFKQERDSRQDSFTCVGCGEGLDDDAYQMSVYIYPPRQEQLTLAFQLCYSCALHVTTPVIQRGEKLRNRSLDSRATLDEAWGIYR